MFLLLHPKPLLLADCRTDYSKWKQISLTLDGVVNDAQCSIERISTLWQALLLPNYISLAISMLWRACMTLHLNGNTTPKRICNTSIVDATAAGRKQSFSILNMIFAVFSSNRTIALCREAYIGIAAEVMKKVLETERGQIYLHEIGSTVCRLKFYSIEVTI